MPGQEADLRTSGAQPPATHQTEYQCRGKANKQKLLLPAVGQHVRPIAGLVGAEPDLLQRSGCVGRFAFCPPAHRFVDRRLRQFLRVTQASLRLTVMGFGTSLIPPLHPALLSSRPLALSAPPPKKARHSCASVFYWFLTRRVECTGVIQRGCCAAGVAVSILLCPSPAARNRATK